MGLLPRGSTIGHLCKGGAYAVPVLMPAGSAALEELGQQDGQTLSTCTHVGLLLRFKLHAHVESPGLQSTLGLAHLVTRALHTI